MRGKILFAAGIAVGYVLGTRAGRERYEEIKRAAASFWNDPRVQHRVDQVEGFVKDKVPEAAEFVSDSAKKVVGKVTGSSSAKTATKSSTTKSTTAKSAPAAKKPATRAASSGSSS